MQMASSAAPERHVQRCPVGLAENTATVRIPISSTALISCRSAIC